MSIVIKEKKPVTYGMKVAATIIAIFIIIGLLARFTMKAGREPMNPPQALGQLLTASSSLLIPSIRLNAPADAVESVWTAALAKSVGGKTEVKVDFGRADVITDNYAIEVDFLHKWKEGLGQALYYAEVTKLIPVLALIVTDSVDKDLLKQIEGLCTEKGVKLLFLVPDN